MDTFKNLEQSFLNTMSLMTSERINVPMLEILSVKYSVKIFSLCYI